MDGDEHLRATGALNEQLAWLHPQRVLLAERRGSESTEALDAFTDRLTALAESEGRQPVHVVWDMTGLEIGDVDKRIAMRSINRILKHLKVGWFVVVERRTPRPGQKVMQLALRISGIHWTTARTKDDALALLRGKDPSLL